MRSQQASWDSIEVEGVQTIYYYGGNKTDKDIPTTTICSLSKHSMTACFNCTDSYFFMSEKFQRVLELVKDWDYQYIFRTNSSSYCHKQRLKNFAQTLPTEKLYAGWTTVDSEDFGGLVVSGAGIFLSRDTAEILRQQIDPSVEREEDVEVGRILRRNGIVAIDDKSRFDVGEFVEAYPPTDRYHYRLKNGDRYLDAQNFYRLHEKIK